MRFLSKMCAVLAWAVTAICGVLIQLLCLYAFATYWDKDGKVPFVLTAIAVAAAVAGILVYTICKKHRFVGAILASIAGVLFLICAFSIRQTTMPEGILTMKPDGNIAMDSWKLVWRHISPVLAPIFLWLSLLFSHIDKERRETAEIMSHIQQGTSSSILSDGEQNKP